MRLIGLCLCFVVSLYLMTIRASVVTEIPSSNALDFMSLISGVYMGDSITVAGEDYQLIHGRYLMAPVDIPGLPQRMTLLFEEKVGDIFFPPLVLSLSEAGNDVTRMDAFLIATGMNFTGNLTTDVASAARLTTADLVPAPGCRSVFQKVSRTVYRGVWADCDGDETPPKYPTTWTCAGSSSTEIDTYPLPFIFYRTGLRLPPYLLSSSGNYTPPCPYVDDISFSLYWRR